MNVLLTFSLNALQKKTTERRSTDKAEKGASRTRSKKDPNAPKRAASAYMHFCQDWRERIKAENADANFGSYFTLSLKIAKSDFGPTAELGRLLGAKWKEITEEEKKVMFTAILLNIMFHMCSFRSTSSGQHKIKFAPTKRRQNIL